ncbi:tail assembly protein [Pseudomonas cremoricolorata]|uniref:tail assembly protein n=1 Tax=Pseudomonas cremoricolorata TaxID=157783 RepID=UPI000416E2FE|nr:tail assembly protein [Pseudomonas cremoricolorata]
MNATAAHYEPITVIKLYGALGKAFGKVHRRVLQVRNVGDAYRALSATLPGFDEAIGRLDRLGMTFAIFRNGRNITAEEFQRGGIREIRIVPVAQGSKRAGTLQTVIGAVLVAAAFVLSFTPFAGVSPFLYKAGAVMLLGGVVQMLSPQAKGLSMSGSPSNLPSYAFGSARNTTASGNPVPICIGQRRWGGAIISASIEAQDKA